MRFPTMSTALPPFGSERLSRVRDAVSSRSTAVRPSETLVAPLRFVAFWAAIALPFLYLPLLVGGLTGGEPTVFGALLFANVAALVLGHDYHSDADRA
jgi:hypothetical protein